MRIIIDIDGNKVVSARVDSSPISIGLGEAGVNAESAPLRQEIPTELLVRAKEMGATSAGQAQIEPLWIQSATLETLGNDSPATNIAIDAGAPNPDLLRYMVQQSNMQTGGEISWNIETIDAGKPLTPKSKTTRKARKRGVKNG